MIKNDIISIERCWYIVDHLVYSPRMWRSSQQEWLMVQRWWVFSTYVEVIPTGSTTLKSSLCILHVCGGHPDVTLTNANAFAYSPRMWRSSCFGKSYRKVSIVFSTYVEVILGLIPLSLKPSGILHVCGGHPHSDRVAVLDYEYSPRMWRSS